LLEKERLGLLLRHKDPDLRLACHIKLLLRLLSRLSFYVLTTGQVSRLYAMCPAHIAFSTPKKPRFLWTDSFEDVGTAELEELLVECRNALHSIDAELAARSDPQVDTNLTNCYAKLQAKALSINRLGALSDQDRTSLEKARTFLGALKSGNIRYSQTRETRKGYGNFERLVWLTSRVAGPAFALLLICSLEKRTLDRLTSSRSTILLKHVVQNCDSLSSRVLEEKAIEFGLSTGSIRYCLTS